MRCEYVISCPVCNEEFAATRKSDIKWMKSKLREHLEKSHVREVELWYERNRKNWRYVKRECLKPFKKKLPVGVVGGRVLKAEADEEALRKLEEAENLSDLLSALEDICTANMRMQGNFAAFATAMQAAVLREWLFSYFIEHTTTVKMKCLSRE